MKVSTMELIMTAAIHRIDQRLLPGAQGLALGAAIEAIERSGIAGFVSRHGARQWQR